METLMRLGSKAFRKSCVVAGCLVLVVALQSGYAQKQPTVSANAARAILVEKARALELRGRPDMAIQIWQQILLSDPKNTDALAGIAKDYKMTGATEKADAALNILRAVNPNDPNIAKIEAMASTKSQSEALRQAGELARQGKLDDAMRIYRSLYGDHPPDGDIALAYYQTLYGATGGKEEAITAMRSLAARNPGDPRYAIALGAMLTYDPRTRAEGIRILRAHSSDADAESDLRQALIWDSANPASAEELRRYLKDHPQDTEVARILKEDETKLAQMNSGIARTPEERAAFAALNAHKLDEAQTRFAAILDRHPDNGRALAGMGFLRMQQRNFGGAVSYLSQAEQNGYRTRIVENALLASRFWYTMSEATQAFAANQLGLAADKYRNALVLQPRSPEALMGLAGLLTKEQQYPAAAALYERLVKVQPDSTPAWRGLFLAYALEGQNQSALDVSTRLPAQIRAALSRDPDYLRNLANVYHALNRNAEAQRVLALALTLPYPANGAGMQADTKLEYAGILMDAKHFDQAADLYAQIVNADPGKLPAWMGLISAHHELGQDNLAIDDVQRMPPATYETALNDAGFLSMLGAIYQQANQFEIAQKMLERAVKLQIAAGGQPSIALQLQLAAIYLQRNNTAQAFDLYRKVLAGNPDRAVAWKGLIATLQATNRNTEALDEIAQIPATVRRELESEIDFVQTEASLYAAVGDIPRAVQYMNRIQAHYAKLKILPPPNIDIQNAWLLFNTHNDRALYPALMRLGGRQDLTIKQRETVQEIWADWSVRRAAFAMNNGYVQRAVDILDAASQAFPDNMTVRKAVAGGYAQVGRAKESVALYKTIPMQDATSGDFQGAIGAALAANDRTHAELWLRQALERYPRDPAILSLAARYEQARGDNQRAADYYRAALAVMPQVSPTDRLAHTLVYPEQDLKAHRAVTAADLQRLLDPNYEPFAKTTKEPPLPAYGADPYNGSAPVILPPDAPQTDQQPEPQTAPPDAPHFNAPHSEQELPPPPAANSAIRAIPAAQSSGPQLYPQLSTAQAGNSQPIDPDYPQLRLRYAASQSGSTQAQLADQSYAQSVPLSLNPPHSLASDTWKGLIFSLMAGNRNQEALEEIQKIPPDVRKQLEADVAFVQGEASLYVAVGDVPRAMQYIDRVENFYLLRRASPPAGLEIQHAWLLYNISDDRRLYPVLLRLDSRPDLTTAQRQQVDTLWADWAVRRALFALDNGNIQRGVEILQAAAQQYPNNLNIRRAVAGAYNKIGRAADSLALFKTIPMQDATSGDFQGAIGAAMAATDMAQAEAWLRQALARFPGDPRILALAARFEQARGDNQRAIEFWRASLAAMPPGATAAQRIESGLAYPLGNYRAPEPGDMKRLLDPANEPPAQTTKLPPLPSYHADVQSAPADAPTATQQNQWIDAPSANPLPLPPGSAANHSGRAPVYVPQSMGQGSQPGKPVFIEQSATRAAVYRLAVYTSGDGQQAQSASQTGSSSSQTGKYTGTVNLPPSEENIDSTDAAPGSLPGEIQTVTPVESHPTRGLRITSEPMNSLAMQVQAQFADQTDSQLTQGSAMFIHALPGAQADSSLRMGASPGATGRYAMAQYTPSAQEAATGAYSSPKQQTTSQECPQTQNCTQPAAKPPALTRRKRRRKAAKAAAAESEQTATPTPTLESAPAGGNPDQLQVPEPQTAPATTGAGLTDQELEQRNLPPLRGPWVRIQREERAPSPRDEAEMELHAIESGYSGWLGGTGILNYRSGNLGYDHLSALEAPFEASMPLGYNARLTFIAKPVFLDSGQADGTSLLTVQAASSPGSPLVLVPIPQPIGSLVPSATTVPAQQNAAGIGGEAQLAFPHLAIAGGYTPAGFLVATFTARAQWKPGNGPITFNFVRDSMKDSQLSYAGLRDPAGNTLGNEGQIWGGVVANSGNAQYVRGDAQSGFYFGAGGQYLHGYNVENNIRIDGTGGSYWRMMAVPEYGTLSVGVNFFGMHYSHNEDAFTYGMGGYFSPQAYFLANIPFTWNAHYQTRWHYNIVGSLGVQAFQEDATPLFPQISSYFNYENSTSVTVGSVMYSDLTLPAKTSVGPNYDLRSQVAYQISPHWFAGGFFGANNARNYSAVSTGFYVRFLFRAQPSTATGPTGLFPMFPPNDGLRPFTVP